MADRRRLPVDERPQVGHVGRVADPVRAAVDVALGHELAVAAGRLGQVEALGRGGRQGWRAVAGGGRDVADVDVERDGLDGPAVDELVRRDAVQMKSGAAVIGDLEGVARVALRSPSRDG